MKELFAVVGVSLAVFGYIAYFKDIAKGKTKPHAFTWFIWATLTAIAFFAQYSEGGGVGAAVLGVTALVSYIIFFVALKVGKKNIAKIDWVFLVASLFALVLWGLTDDPLLSIILITIVDSVAFAPTFRKAYKDPSTETLSTFLLSGIKFVFAIGALEAYSVATVLYPASLVLANFLFVGLLIVRRRAIVV